MAGKAKGTRKARPLVGGYLERISSEAFSEFPRELTGLVGKQHGVYALYKGKQLYYCGLAANLRTRIKHHLRDRHRGKWDRFSLYLIHEADHIKEIESLILRIACPAGNRTSGRLGRATNLRAELAGKMKRAQEKHLHELLWTAPTGRARGDWHSRAAKKAWRTRNIDGPPLAPYVKGRFVIHATYKGREYSARVWGGGRISFDGKLYDSPTAAAHAITHKNINGWWFWKYKSDSGEWLRLRTMRRKS